MDKDVSIAHEFYKIRNKWKTIANKKWNMAMWVCDYRDIDILDKFMEIEASPIGVFDDIFFRFQSIYTNDEVFEKNIWDEFLSWFDEREDNPYDLITAFKTDGYLPEDYHVNRELTPTFENIISEFLRLKAFLPLDEENFILYFAPALHEIGFQTWFYNKLKNGLPNDIRLVTIDVEAKRTLGKLREHKTATIFELKLSLDMASAMKNEMDKDSDASRPQAPSGKFQKQIRKVMDATVNKEIDLQKEVDTLVYLGHQLNLLNTKATSYLTSAIAFSSKRMHKDSMVYANKAIEITELEIDNGEEAYPIWRSAIMIKASLFLIEKKKDEAISCYQELAKIATSKVDAFYVMEAYRMIAFIEFKRKKLSETWQASIFSLQAGTNLPIDVRRASTYLHAAAVAYQVVQDRQETDEVIEELEEQFTNFIGDDWKKLLQDTEMINIKYMNRKKPLKA